VAAVPDESITPAKLANGGRELGFRNRLINAQGNINQRGYVSGTTTTGANQYTVDRWRVVVSGQALSWTTSGNDLTFTAPAGGVEQVIEGSNLDTGTHVLSWTGAATATVGGSAVANGGTVSVTGGVNLTVRFSGGTFTHPQFEPGSVATPFERRPFGTELQLCQRYAILYTNCQFPTNTVSTPMFYVSCLGMRATPTVTHNIADANYANNPSANQWGYVDAGSGYSTKSGTLSEVSVWSSQATVGLRPLGATFSPTPNLAILNSNVFVLLASEL
jgi:hypothetical protein